MATTSPTQTDRIAACVGKVAFLTAEKAFRALRTFTRRRKFQRVPGERVEPYKCRCGAWHIGRALK